MSRRHLDFEQVKREVTIPQVLEVFGILGQFTMRGDRLRGVCPIPTHRHNSVKPNDQQWVADCKKGIWLWRCFSPECSLGGDVTELVRQLAGLEDYKHVRLWFLENFPQLAEEKPPDNARGESPDTKRASEDVGQLRHSPAPIQSTHNVSELCPPLKPLRWFYSLDQDCEYLREGRGFNAETIKRFGLGLCSRGYLSRYIAIPVYLPGQAASENPVAYVGRFAGEKDTWDAGTPRWKFWQEFPKSKIVYGLREALQDSPAADPLVIVEGALKVAWLWQEAGLPNVVATFGASLSDEQAAILAATARPLVLMWDGNAHDAQQRAAARLHPHAYVRTVTLPEDQEPDDLSGDKLGELLHFLH